MLTGAQRAHFDKQDVNIAEAMSRYADKNDPNLTDQVQSIKIASGVEVMMMVKKAKAKREEDL